MTELHLDRADTHVGRPAATPRKPDMDASGAAAPAQVEPAYQNVDDWLVEWLLPTILSPRRKGTLHWCPKWYLHPEVVNRLDGLWRAWEVARVEGPPSTLNWWRDHFDYHWAVLTGPQGPMAACGDDRHDLTEPLPVARRADYNPEQFTLRPAWLGDPGDDNEDDLSFT